MVASGSATRRRCHARSHARGAHPRGAGMRGRVERPGLRRPSHSLRFGTSDRSRGARGRRGAARMTNRATEKTLILGGVRSGKSRYAGELAAARGRAVTVIATGAAKDEEMAARIEAHRASRPAHWSVIEEPLRLAAALRTAAVPGGVIVVDCLTLWLSNLLCLGDE